MNSYQKKKIVDKIMEPYMKDSFWYGCHIALRKIIYHAVNATLACIEEEHRNVC